MLLSRIRSLWSGIFRRNKVESGIFDELQFHIQACADKLMEQGMSGEEAIRRARLEFGSAEKYKEEIRQARGLRLFDEIRGDLRYASRMLKKSPSFTLAAIAILALGIASTTVVFSLINEVFIKKLPVKNPDELVQFDWLRDANAMVASYAGSGRPDPTTGRVAMTSFPDAAFRRFAEQNRTLSDVFAFTPAFTDLNVVTQTDAEIASGEFVSGGYFAGFGVTAKLGRMILPSDDGKDAHGVVVISNAY